MPNDQVVDPGQLTAIPASNYDVNKDLGRVIDRTNVVDAPTAPNLLFNSNVPTTGDGRSKVNPLYAQYINVLKNSPTNKINKPLYTNENKADGFSNDSNGGYNPYDANLENWYGENQSWLKQWGNRIGKFGIKALGSFAGSLMDIPNMVNSAVQGDIDKLWNNPTNTWATDMMAWSDKALPNYQTNWEREHPFLNLIPFYGNSGNGWGNVFEQVGFTAGAIGGAIVEDLGVAALTGGVGEIPLAAQQINKAVYNLGKLIGAGEDGVSALKNSIKSADELVKGLKGIDRFNYGVRQGLWGANMITSGFSEAAFEGIESYKTLSKDLNQEFLEKNGRLPSYAESQRIEETSKTAANSRFLMNAALLAMTNSIQWGNLLRPLNATKDILEAEAKSGIKVALKEGSKDLFESIAPSSSRLAKFANFAKDNLLSKALIESGSEGFEEGAQFLIQNGVDDYYKRKYDNPAIDFTNNFMKSFGTGLSKTLGTTEGWENIVFGLLGGAMYKGGEHGYYKAKGIETPNYKKEIDSVVQGLNSQSLTGIFENKYGEAVAASSIEKDLMTAAKANNPFLFNNYKHEQFVNFVLSGIKQNKFETRINQLDELKKLNADEFQKTFGISFTEDNKKSVTEYVDNLKQNANYINDIAKRVNRTFINPFKYSGTGNYKNAEQKATQDKINEQAIAYEGVKEQMINSMSIAKNSADRIASLKETMRQIDPVISSNSDIVTKISSDEGLKDLKTEYSTQLKILKDAYQIDNKPLTNKDLKWHEDRIAQIDRILDEKDKEKQNKAYSEFVDNVFDRMQLDFDTLNNNGTKPRTVKKFDRIQMGEALAAGRDIFYLQKRSDVAVSNYAALTTKGGFKKLFDDITKIRAEIAARNVPLAAETTQPTNPQQAAATAQAQAQNGLPIAGTPQETGFEESKTEALTPDQKKLLGNALQSIVDKKYEPSEQELEALGFSTIDDIKFDNPKADITQYTKVKATNGKNFYMLTSQLNSTIKDYLGATASPVAATTPPPVAPVQQPSGDGKGKSPLRVEDFLNKAFVPADLRPAFTNAIFSGTAGEVKSKISFTVKALSAEDQKAYTTQKETGAYTEVKGYPKVYVSKQPIDISIEHSGTEIGKLPYPEKLLFSVNNQLVNINKVTPQQYQQLTGRNAAQYAQDLQQYYDFVGLKNYLALRFKNNGNKPVTITAKEAQDLFNVNITYGELDLVPSAVGRPLYSTLDPKLTNITLPGTSENVSTMAIISVPRVFKADTLSYEKTENYEFIMGQNFYADPGTDDRVLRDWVNKNIAGIHAINSRYIGVVQRPDGTFQPVALRAASASSEDLSGAFDQIITNAAASAEENFKEVQTKEESDGALLVGDETIYYKLPSDAAKSRNDKFNSALSNQFYITDPQGKVRYDLSVSPIGAIRLEVYDPTTKNRTTLYINPQRLGAIKSFGDMVDAFNKAIQNKAKADPAFAALKLELKPENFKRNIPSDTKITADVAAPLLSSATTTGVFKNGTLRVQPNTAKITEAYKAAGGKTKADAVIKEEEKKPESVDPITDLFGAPQGLTTVKGGIFGGLTQLPSDENGDLAAAAGIADVSSSNKNQINNQEPADSKVYANVKEALASQDIGFRNDEARGVVFYNVSSNSEIDSIQGVTPLDLAKQLGLKFNTVKTNKKNDPFTFKVGEQGQEELARQINIESAKAWIYANLPSFISVEDIDKVMDQISVKGQVYGAFSNGVIYLSQAAEAGTEYHEAFHSVFRTLLNDEQIDGYLKTAQSQLYNELKAKGKSINSLLAEKRALGLYEGLTNSEAYDRLYEEHMADRFMDYKNKKDKGGFFSKLFELINKFFKWVTRNKSDLDALFRKIDSGEFRYSNIQANRFTTDSSDEYTEPEFALQLIPTRPGQLEVGKGVVAIKRNLDAKTSKQTVQTVASYFNTYKHTSSLSQGLSDDKLVDKVLDDLRNLYDINNPIYAGYNEEQLAALVNSDEGYIYSNDESRGIIKEGVKKYVDSMNYIEQFREEDKEDNEQDTGVPSTGYDNSSENVGGYSSLPGLLRQYIGFTTYEKVDDFGNKELINGVPVVGTVDAVHVYYGLLRTLANITDPVKFFQKMVVFADENPQTQKFVEKFLKDTGLNKEALDEGRIEATNNKTLVELVKKGFNKFRIDYVFTEHDINKGQVKSYHANRKNVEQVQFDKWANTFSSTYSDYSQDSQKDVRQSIDDIRTKYFDPRRTTKYAGEKINEVTNETQRALRGVGIQLSKAYIKYSLLAGNAAKFDELNEKYKKEGVSLQFDDPKNTFIDKQDYNYVQIMKVGDEIALNHDFFQELSRALAADNNPFFKGIKETSEVDELGATITTQEEIDTAMVSRLLNVARGNSLFDESVGESSYTNAENKVVYAHQDGTFNVKFTYQLRDANYRKQLREQGYREEATAYRDAYDKEWLTENFLLNSDAFETIADNLLFQRIDGMRAVETNKLGRVITQEFRDQKEGATYGHYSSREFLVNLVNLYVSYSKEQKTSKGNIFTAPHLIRVLEASKTGDTVNLPINTDVFRAGTVTSKAVDILYNEVTREFGRIQRVNSEIGSIKENVVENYHTGSFADDNFTITKGYRGLQFTDNITSLISNSLATQLATKARTGETITKEDMAQVKAQIAASINKIVEDSVDVMEKEGIIKRNAKGEIQNVLLHREFMTGNQNLNLTKRFKDNIGHVLVNDYINTLAYNQLLHGDSALSLKNDGGIDAVKRAKGDNAAIVSMRTDLVDESLGIMEPFTHSSVAIFKEPTKKSSLSDKNIDIADAQMYTTVKGLRYTLWGLGRLTPRLAKALDAMERNEQDLVDKSVFDEQDGLIKWNEQTNSLKLVYKDGKSYYKMSVVVLQPNLTSYEKKGKLVARPGWETLHNLRTKMEGDGIHFAAPQSASKMMTMDVGQDNSKFSDLKGHLFDNTYFGLQTVTPSNKLDITTPTQLLQLIDTEQNNDSQVNYGGKDMTVGELKNLYQDYVSQKVQNAYQVAKNDIYQIEDFKADLNKSISEGKVTPRLAKFQKKALGILELSGGDGQLLDFFSLDDNGNPKFNLNMSATKDKFGQLYLSYFSKGILSQKSPGYTVALMSGMDTKVIKKATRIVDGKVVSWEVVRREAWDANVNGVQNEQINRSIDDVTTEGEHFLDELKYNVPERDENGDIIPGKFYSEMMMPPHFKGLLETDLASELPEAIAKMFGVRIPSQDKHSFMSFKMVDFLPSNLGSTGMFPKELIALSGADFDIDKLFMSRYDFYTSKSTTGKTKFTKYGDATTTGEKWEEYKQWMTKNNKSVKEIVNTLATQDADYQRLLKEDKKVLSTLDDIFDTDVSNSLKIKYKNRFVSAAFKQLGLPSTQEEFEEESKDKELNNGVINNRLVDAYTGLLTNSGIRKIAETPATTNFLSDIQYNEDITLRDKDGKVIGSVFSKKNTYPVDSLAGKYYAFRNNSTGKDNIGINVNANLIYSILNKGDVNYRSVNDDNEKLAQPFSFDGVKFDSFGHNNEYNPLTGKFDGRRTNDIHSTLISSATDEAKDQLNALYNLNVDALKVVDYMVSLKVPLKTAIYFVNQPLIRNYVEIKAVRNNTLQTAGEERLFRDAFVEEAKAKLSQQIKDYKDLSDDDLVGMFEKEGILERNCV